MHYCGRRSVIPAQAECLPRSGSAAFTLPSFGPAAVQPSTTRQKTGMSLSSGAGTILGAKLCQGSQGERYDLWYLPFPRAVVADLPGGDVERLRERGDGIAVASHPLAQLRGAHLPDAHFDGAGAVADHVRLLAHCLGDGDGGEGLGFVLAVAVGHHLLLGGAGGEAVIHEDLLGRTLEPAVAGSVCELHADYIDARADGRVGLDRIPGAAQGRLHAALGLAIFGLGSGDHLRGEVVVCAVTLDMAELVLFHLDLLAPATPGPGRDRRSHERIRPRTCNSCNMLIHTVVREVNAHPYLRWLRLTRISCLSRLLS